MQLFFAQLVNGISLGSIYALIALGYTMVYGVMRLINFAHCDIYMLGAYVGYACMTFWRLPVPIALVAAMSVCTMLGIAIERTAYRPLRSAERISLLITALGVSQLLQYCTMLVVSPNVRTYPPIKGWLAGVFTVWGVRITALQCVILATALTLMGTLNTIVKHTRTGRAMRAVAQDRDTAQLMGIDVDATISHTFAIGSALAGAAGVLVGIYYNTINPLMGTLPGLKAFVAAVFGGIGVIPGAMLGGYFIGVVEVMVAGYGNSMMRDAVVFTILIVVLIIRPTGLLGSQAKEKV